MQFGTITTMASEIISKLDTKIYAEIALIIFMVVFLVIVLQTIRRPGKEMDKYSRLPIENDENDNMMIDKKC